MDAETIIRDAARKLCKQYTLPTHIVEEDLLVELKPLLKPEATEVLPKDLNIKVERRDDSTYQVTIEGNDGGKQYVERQPAITRRSIFPGATITTINLFLKAATPEGETD